MKRLFKRFHITQLSGILVSLDSSWFIVLFLIIWSISSGDFQGLFFSLPDKPPWFYGFLFTFLILFSIVFHELIQLKISISEGFSIRCITLFFLGSVKELFAEPPSPKAEFRLALYGFLSYIIMGSFAAILLLLLPTKTNVLKPVLIGAQFLFTINSFLLILNCIPILPFDAARILRAYLWQRNEDIFKATEKIRFIGKSIAWMILFFALLEMLQGNILTGVWLLFIGLWIKDVIESSYQLLTIKKALAGLKVQNIMTRNVFTLPADLTLQEFVDSVLWKKGYHSYPVISQNQVVGLIRLNDIAGISRNDWKYKTIIEVMTKLDEIYVVFPSTSLARAFHKSKQNKIGRLVVLDKNKKLVGYISQRDISDLLTLKSQDVILNP